ncbi:mucin-5AC [Nocardioides sp. Root1257]|uniref:class I SAM-dependent methyltransferase n=1 Tax=unclassified Nocardioides TaxID=2615069 RepID=UPI0006F5B0AE|nr:MULTISPECIES: class I SAM-dependent methyltransferase [unclassified Nocardioides]KQW48816.1 mucin-5AC [Nocardioides sp. Root1257]KRC47991.1 mucin-5AC [Nocardioides sp. Root224]
MSRVLSQAPAPVVTVSGDGLLLRSAPAEPQVVSFDGRYIWAFTAARDGRSVPGGVLVEWPPVLRRFLDGTVRVRVADVTGDRVLHDQEVLLGAGDGRVQVVDPQGLPLAVDKVGHLCRAFDDTAEGVRAEILTGTRRALDDLRDVCGVEAYLNYGALLGAVRDGAMIAHDSDTDVCYLSRHTSPADIIAESYRIQRALKQLGWTLLRMSGGDIKLLLPLSDGRLCHIDVFVAFRVGGTFYQLGNRSGRLLDSVILPVSTITLHGVELPAPADPEAMLAFIYGPGWRVPDPSFKYADPVRGVRRLDGWLRGFRTDMGRWTEFHQGAGRRLVRGRRSTFAKWVDRQLPRGAPVAEIGCGTGRDALWLARRGHPVIAFDFSRAARAAVLKRARHRRLHLEVRALILNELRTVLLAGAELARDPHHLAARHLLGCLDDRARSQLWLLCRMALRGGGTLFLEFSADTGVGAPDPEPAGLVRRLDPDVVRREIEAAGGRVVRARVRAGVDVLGHPDPTVCRMRVAWTRPEHPTSRRTAP